MAEVNVLEWHITPFRRDRFLEHWEPAAARVLSFGATSWSLIRSIDDPLHFTQTSVWESRDDFERYWYSEEIATVREQIVDYYAKPLLPSWHAIVAAE